MIRSYITWAGAVFIAVSIVSATVRAQARPEVALRAAIELEESKGDLKGAIEQYMKLADGRDRTVAAKALLRLAEAYQKLGDARAKGVYERIIREFADQKEVVAIATARSAPARSVSPGSTLQDVEGLNLPGNVTADGRYASYVSGSTGNIAVRDLQTGTARDITRRQDWIVEDPVLSRDGKFVAYLSFNGCIERKSDRPSNGVLCVLPIEGEPAATSKTVFERTDVREVTPMDWSPDGRSIAVVLRRLDGTAQIGTVRVADGALTVLQSTDWRGATRIFFSPDGRYVAFDVPLDDTSDQRDIRVVAVDGSDGATAVKDSSQNVIMGWTPDGTHLLFASDRAGTMGLWAQRVTKGRPEGASRLVHAGLGGARSLGVTRGASLYFEVDSGSRDIEIVMVDFAAGKQVSSPVRPISRYVGTNWMPEWSRDGKFLAYVSRRGVSGNDSQVIAIRDSSTGVVRELRPKLLYINGLAWAPDNSALLTTGSDLRGRSGVFTIDARTGEISFVVEGTYPIYAPDGRLFFYVKGPGGAGPNAITERNLISGAERTIATGEMVRFSLSPDGRWVAAMRGGIRANIPSAEEIVIIGVENGDVRPVFRARPGDRIPPYIPAAWTPDGQGLLVRTRAPEEALWLVPTTGGTPRKIEAEVQGWQFGPAGMISIHPDGRQIVGTRVRQDGGAAVRVLENFLPIGRK